MMADWLVGWLVVCRLVGIGFMCVVYFCVSHASLQNFFSYSSSTHFAVVRTTTKTATMCCCWMCDKFINNFFFDASSVDIYVKSRREEEEQTIKLCERLRLAKNIGKLE